MTSPSPADQPVQYLKGVGPKRADLLKELAKAPGGYRLGHFPRDWQDRRETADLSLPTATGLVVLQGRVVRSGPRAAGPSLTLFKATLAARQGTVEAVWFKHRSR